MNNYNNYFHKFKFNIKKKLNIILMKYLNIWEN